MNKHNSYVDYGVTLRKKVCKLLDEDPLLKPKALAKMLGLTNEEYKKQRQTLTNYRNFWKYNHQNERGSKCCESHHCRYRGFVGGEVDRGLAVGCGWVLSRARNRFLIFRSKLGRVVWFETGRLRLFVRKPANEGKAKTLFCEAFFRNGLITDLKVLNACLAKVCVKGAHSVFPTKMRLPYTVIDSFVDSHGILIKLGDRSHPNSVEVIWEVTNQLEKIEDKVSFVYDVFQQVNNKSDLKVDGVKPLERIGDYSR